MKLIGWGFWISFELAMDKYGIDPSMVYPSCVDWDKQKIFIAQQEKRRVKDEHFIKWSIL